MGILVIIMLMGLFSLSFYPPLPSAVKACFQTSRYIPVVGVVVCGGLQEKSLFWFVWRDKLFSTFFGRIRLN